METNQHTRCPWCEANDLLRQYHDEEWGVIRHDDRVHYENLLMEAMQCGLSWNLVLQKREILRQCFAGFDYDQVAEFTDADVDRIMATEGMVRSERKIRGVIGNTKVFLDIQKEYGSFDKYIWSFTDNKVIIFRGEQPTQCEASRNLAADLKKRGAKFLGPVVLHSHMEALGLIMAHSPECWRYREFMASRPENVIYF